jgi:hypothetical protein
MIIDAIQSLAQLLSKSSQLPNNQMDRQAAYQIQLTPGQQVQAELLASLPNQRYLARIAGKLFNIELPIIVQPGETLQLTYVSEEPNLTFTLSRSGNTSAPVTISDAGKLLNQASLNPADPRQAGAINRGGTILNGAPSDTSIFAGLLGEALSLNGIFYESHLLQWFYGERSIRDILKEPQGRLSRRARGEGAKRADVNGAEGNGDDSVIDELLANGEKSEAVDPRTLPIINEQLKALHSGQVFWHGEVWPGQEMEWSVLDDKKRSGDGVERNWLSTINIELPNLGRVEATLRLGREGVSIHLNNEKESSSLLMRREREALAQSFSDAGIKLLDMVVDHEKHG